LDSKNFLGKIKDYIDEKFYVGPKSIIGIDIGLSAIKMAEVTKSGDTYKINAYASVELPEGAIIEDEIQKEDEVLKALQSCLKKLNTSSKLACIGLSGPNTLIKKLQLGSGTYEEIEDNVIWEIEQYLPFSIDDGNVSFSILSENAGGGVEVMIGAAKKSLINSYKDLVERINLKVKIVDLAPAATINVYENVLSELANESGATQIILDLGAQKTQFFIYKNGLMAFYKEIAIGGLTITEEIQRQMGVNFAEAESLKIHGDGNGNIPEEIVDIINQVLDSFFAELKKTIDFWVSSTSEESFEHCIITGGSSLIPGFNEALEEVVGTEVLVLNPFAKMSFNQNKITEDMINDIAYRGICAIGLAMRTVEK
jgi:type IV pilus assembly protein PilM